MHFFFPSSAIQQAFFVSKTFSISLFYFHRIQFVSDQTVDPVRLTDFDWFSETNQLFHWKYLTRWQHNTVNHMEHFYGVSVSVLSLEWAVEIDLCIHFLSLLQVMGFFV